ncbi:hypothetical protein CPB84DRAFT_1852488 [Gymnopilus junonius]|uniref:Uncharacterized protein n=1 Tax=Gymnopilus junonius TaxID=109634 RepID=A0A9P5TGF3_GYMJU|nr:hypothetical protein CPB84DRAFT_1852488 [Gymnopilus junonius]
MLKSLEIGDWASSGDIAYFLAHLVIPGTAKRCIWGKDLKYLSSILFPVDPGTARTLGRGWDIDVRQVNFTAAKGQNMIGIYNHAVFIQGGFNFLSIYPLFRDHPRIFERVEKLCLTPAVAEAALTADEYRLIFATLPNVQHLSMFDMDVSLIFQALGLFEILTPHDVPFPELKAITIRYSRSKGHLDATSPTRDFLGNKYKLSPLSIVLGLVKLSQQRAAIGCPLTTLLLIFKLDI